MCLQTTHVFNTLAIFLNNLLCWYQCADKGREMQLPDMQCFLIGKFIKERKLIFELELVLNHIGDYIMYIKLV